MPALGSSHRCRGCCACAVPHRALVLPFAQMEHQGKIQKGWRDFGGAAALEKVGCKAGFPPPAAAEKGQRVLFSYLGEVQRSWHENDSFQCPQRGRRGCILFSTSAGAVCGKHCWHWDLVLLGFCSVLQIRLLFPCSLCRNGKHVWAFKHILKSIKAVLKYISLL